MTQPSTHPSQDGLRLLVRRAFECFQSVDDRADPYVVRPAVPILWFGDIDAYRQSPIRVVSVGLNPSRAEFPSTDPFRRLRAAASVGDVSDDVVCDRYVQALRSYFLPTQDAYRSWFRSFEPLLNGMGVSYYPGAASTAVHTDICTPIATDPTWSQLPVDARQSLVASGRSLWHALVRELAPHVILASVAAAHLVDLEFEIEADWETIHTVRRTNPYDVRARRLRLDDTNSSLLVFGRAAQKPFALISDEEKRRLGATVRGLIDA